MKTLLLGALALLSLTVKSQDMNDPKDIVVKLFVATDQQNWQEVEACFAESVQLDYSSMSGNPATKLSPQEITTAWKTILPGFEHTHHQVGNFQIARHEKQVAVFCYGTATHYLSDELGNLWTVVGSYDFDVEDTGQDEWKIASMKFNFKYQDGNLSLPEKAMNKLK